MRYVIPIALVVALAGGGAYWWKARAAKASDGATEQKTAVAERGPLVDKVSSTGRVVANQDVDVRCKASGQVVAVPVDVSAAVSKGDVLVVLDPVDEQRNVDQAKIRVQASAARLARATHDLALAEAALAPARARANADLQAAEARAKEMRLKAERAKQLLAKLLISDDESLTAESAAEQALAALASARVRLDEVALEERALELKRQDASLAAAEAKSDEIALAIVEQRLRDTTVRSPIDGVIAVRTVEVGQIISSAISNVSGGSAVMIVSDLSSIFVLASVDESSIGKVSVGDKATVMVDAYPGRRFPGRVARIATRGVNASNVVTFEVKVEVLTPQKKLLKPEMTASVDIVIGEREDCVTVPVGAVARSRDGATVEVVRADGSTETRAVEVGLSDGVVIEVAKGVEAGEKVVVKAQSQGRWQRGGGDDAARQRAMGRMMMGAAGGGGGRRGR